MVEARPVSRADVVAEARSWIGTPYLLSLSQMSSGWRGTANRVMLSPDVGRLQIAVVAADRVVPIARVT